LAGLGFGLGWHGRRGLLGVGVAGRAPRGWRPRQLADARGCIGLGGAVGQQLRYLALALATGCLQQLFAVVLGQVGGQQDDAGQVQPALGKQLEQDGMAPSGAGGLDSFVGGGFRQAEAGDAVGEHGGAGRSGVELAGVDLAQVQQQLRGAAVDLVQQVLQLIEQVFVGEVGQGAFHGDPPTLLD